MCAPLGDRRVVKRLPHLRRAGGLHQPRRLVKPQAALVQTGGEQVTLDVGDLGSRRHEAERVEILEMLVDDPAGGACLGAEGS